MQLDQALDGIFASASHVRLLRALFALPGDMGRSGRDLARRAEVSHPRANKVLGELADQGLVEVERLPNADLYRLNRRHVLVDSIAQLFELESRLKSDLLSLVAGELKARHLPVQRARIFGSAARGTMGPESDVDLALTTSADSVPTVEAAAQGIAETVRKRFGTRLNVLVGSPAKSRSKGAWAAVEREGIDVLAATNAATG